MNKKINNITCSKWNNTSINKWNNINAGNIDIIPNYKVFLDAGNSASYSGSGSIWTNLGSATANGTIVNGTYSTAGGGAIAFNGTSTYVDCGANASIADITSFTIQTWFNTSIATGMNLVYKSDDNSSAGWFQDLRVGYTTAGCSVVHSSANARSYINRTPIALNSWVCLTSTWSGGSSYSSLANYVNGIKYTPTTTVNGSGTRSSDAAQPLQIGRRRTGAYVYFNGLIGSVLIYDRALTQTEITQNFNAQKVRFGL